MGFVASSPVFDPLTIDGVDITNNDLVGIKEVGRTYTYFHYNGFFINFFFLAYEVFFVSGAVTKTTRISMLVICARCNRICIFCRKIVNLAFFEQS